MSAWAADGSRPRVRARRAGRGSHPTSGPKGRSLVYCALIQSTAEQGLRQFPGRVLRSQTTHIFRDSTRSNATVGGSLIKFVPLSVQIIPCFKPAKCVGSARSGSDPYSHYRYRQTAHPFSDVLHRLRIGIRPSRCRTFRRIGGKPSAYRERSIVLIAVAAGEQGNVAEP